jgi:hypothetical protein
LGMEFMDAEIAHLRRVALQGGRTSSPSADCVMEPIAT